MSIFVNFLQLLNTFLPIEIKPSGRITSSNFCELLNKSSSSFLTESENITFFKLEFLNNPAFKFLIT